MRLDRYTAQFDKPESIATSPGTLDHPSLAIWCRLRSLSVGRAPELEAVNYIP